MGFIVTRTRKHTRTPLGMARDLQTEGDEDPLRWAAARSLAYVTGDDAVAVDGITLGAGITLAPNIYMVSSVTTAAAGD